MRSRDVRSPRTGRARGLPVAKCQVAPTRGGPAGAGTAAPSPPPPPPFAARPPGSDTLFFGTGRRCGGRAQRREAAGREEPPAPPALQADPHLLETGFSSAAARLSFYGPTPALRGFHPWAVADLASSPARVPLRPPVAGVPCVPLGQALEPGVPGWGVGTLRPKLLAPFVIREPGASETWNFRSGWSWAPRSQVDTPHLPTPGPRMPRTCRPHRGLILNRGGAGGTLMWHQMK